MAYLRQFAIILLISLIGEILNFLLPFPIPASIYGVVILFVCLYTGVIQAESIRGAARFLIAVMSVMFVPAAVGLMESFYLILPSLIPYAVILVVSTYAVMIVSGRVTQTLIRKSHTKEENGHE